MTLPRRRVPHPVEPADPRSRRRLHARDPRPRAADGRGRRARRPGAAAPHGRPGQPRRSCAAPPGFDGRDLVVGPAPDEQPLRRGMRSSRRRRAPGCSSAARTRRARSRARVPAHRERGAARRRAAGDPGDPDWHITHCAGRGLRPRRRRSAGVLDGFGALYRAWLAHVVAQLRRRMPGGRSSSICESRQLGELIAGWGDPGVRAHPRDPHHPPRAAVQPDAPLNPLWTRWFSVAERFDAVLWPTAMQRAEVQDRFGASPVHVVVPHAVPAAASVCPLLVEEREAVKGLGLI